jgi:hypothetical protein
MQHAWSAPVLARFRAFALLAAILIALTAGAGSQAATEDSHAYTLEVNDVSAKVGQPAILRATLTIHSCCRIMLHHRNRVGKLSSFDDGVAFAQEVVLGTVENETIVFEIPLKATKPGTHPINGLFRVGFIEGDDSMSIVSLPLIANVVGTE